MLSPSSYCRCLQFNTVTTKAPSSPCTDARCTSKPFCYQNLRLQGGLLSFIWKILFIFCASLGCFIFLYFFPPFRLNLRFTQPLRQGVAIKSAGRFLEISCPLLLCKVTKFCNVQSWTDSHSCNLNGIIN